MKSHSKILFWLLVAATLSVDAVAIAWMVQAGPMSRAVYLLDGLVTGQLAVVCIWAVFAARQMWSALAAITVAVGISTALDVWTAWMNAQESFGTYAALAAVFVIALWTLKQTPFWRRIADRSSTGWQFSMGQVLVVMTIVALLLTLLRRTELTSGSDDWRFLVAIGIADTLIVLSAVVAAVAWRDWWVRLACDCAVAIGSGMAVTFAASAGWLGANMVAPFAQEVVFIATDMLVIALVLFAWLELAPILPVLRRAELPPPAGLHTT